MASPTIPNHTQVRVATESVVGLTLQVGTPQTGDPDNGRCPFELRAVTWPGGKRIDLFWTSPSDVTRVVIKRSQLYHSAFIDDQTEVIYEGPPIDHFIDGVKVASTYGHSADVQTPPELEVGIYATNVALDEDTYYYYTVYMTVAEGPVGIFDYGLEAASDCQVTGLSILDFLAAEGRTHGKWFGEYLYRQFSARTRQNDLEVAKAKGEDRGWFQNFCLFVQGGLNLYRGHARALIQLRNVDRTPAGLVGRAFDQSTILEAWARRFNIPPERHVLDVSILRRIAGSMINLYKRKGTCPALVDFAKVLTTWDATCFEFEDDGDVCNPVFLRTWDNTTTEEVVIQRQLSLVTLNAGSAVIPGAGLEVQAHAGSLVVDSMWTQLQIASNNEDSLVFVDDTSSLRAEDLVTIDAVTSLGGDAYRLAITRTDGGGADLNDQEYDNSLILDSANVQMDVTATVSEDALEGGSSSVTVDSPGGVPTVGVAAVARSFVTGATYADRDPIIEFRIYTGCPTFLYDPLMDIDLLGIFTPDQVNPHDVLYSGGILIGIPFIPGDTILTIESGIAKFVGGATSVSGNTLTDTDANFGPDGSNKFHYLNPNMNQAGTFRIVSNTATTLTVESDIPGVTLEDVAAADSRYAVLSFSTKRYYEILVRVLKLFTPVTTRLFIFFEE